MKLVSFQTAQGEERVGLFVEGRTMDLAASAAKLSLALPSTMNGLLERWPDSFEAARRVELAILETGIAAAVDSRAIHPLAPVPHPGSCRDGYAFRQHVATARRNRGLDMIPEFDQFPVFYFTNHRGIVGEGDVAVRASTTCASSTSSSRRQSSSAGRGATSTPGTPTATSPASW